MSPKPLNNVHTYIKDIHEVDLGFSLDPLFCFE
jgi:hypothetical protein